MGGKAGLLGSCASEDEVPPLQGWRLKRKGEKEFREDAGGFASQAGKHLSQLRHEKSIKVSVANEWQVAMFLFAYP